VSWASTDLTASARGPSRPAGPEPSSVSEQNPGRGLPGDQPAERVADQVHAAVLLADLGGHRDDVLGQRVRRVSRRAGRRRGLVLAAQVDGHHPAAGRGQRLQHGEEVFLAAGVSGHEHGRPPLAHPAARHGLEGGERPAAGLDRDLPYPIGQIERPWSAHGRAAYPPNRGIMPADTAEPQDIA
jgi:hypothetical protein